MSDQDFDLSQKSVQDFDQNILFFDDGSFNDYNIDKLDNTSILYIGPNFKEDLNKVFLKKTNIKGLQTIDVLRTETLKTIQKAIRPIRPKESNSFDDLTVLSKEQKTNFYSKSLSVKNKFNDKNIVLEDLNKFQNTMIKEATRLEFAEKKEKYKKHMSQSSSLSGKLSSSTKLCISSTKKIAKKKI